MCVNLSICLARMGNCLKTVASHDDISLLRDSAPTARESSDQFAAPIGLQLGTRSSQVSASVGFFLLNNNYNYNVHSFIIIRTIQMRCYFTLLQM